MVLSLFVVPVGATGLSENTGSTKSVQNAAPTEKFSIDVTANRYTSGTSTLISGKWLQNLAVENDSLKAFLLTHGASYVDLMPVDGKTKWDINNDATNAIPTFNSDGSVTITQNVDSTHYWPYVYTEEDIVVDLDATPYIYISYGGDAAFNLMFDYNNTGSYVNVGNECNRSDFPAGDHTGTNAYCLNLAEATGLSGVITLNKCLFYTVGAKNTKVILQDIGFVSSPGGCVQI